MARPRDEIAKELRDLGFGINDASLRALAERLTLDEPIHDALGGRRWFPETMSGFSAWLLVSTHHVIAIAISSGGWFSQPSVRALARIRFADILEIRTEYTSGDGQWQGMPATNLTVRTLADSEHLNVPTSWTPEQEVLSFVDRLRERCRPSPAPVDSNLVRSFADEVRLISELKAAGHLSSEEAASAIRKLIQE